MPASLPVSASAKGLIRIEPFGAEPDIVEVPIAGSQFEDLEQLYLQRDERLSRGQSVDAINQEIVLAKRAQRYRPRIQEGILLSGRYHLKELIGRGGFAQVWKAFDRQGQQQVAVKILHRDQGDDARRVERFVRGARQMQRLNHPHILRVLDGPAEYEGDHYFVMELMPKGDLSHAIVQGKIGRLAALRVILQAGAALEYAHTRGLIHRDVKPQNILLDGQNAARLTDFDLVWTSDTTGGTRTSAMMGTFLYAAPEEMEDASRVQRRADIYSLGMTVLFVLHGKSLTRKVLDTRALFIDRLECPDAAKALLRRATALDPDDRPESALEFCTELNTVLNIGIVMHRSQTPSEFMERETSANEISANETTNKAPVPLPENRNQIPAWSAEIAKNVNAVAPLPGTDDTRIFAKPSKISEAVASAGGLITRIALASYKGIGGMKISIGPALPKKLPGGIFGVKSRTRIYILVGVLGSSFGIGIYMARTLFSWPPTLKSETRQPEMGILPFPPASEIALKALQPDLQPPAGFKVIVEPLNPLPNSPSTTPDPTEPVGRLAAEAAHPMSNVANAETRQKKRRPPPTPAAQPHKEAGVAPDPASMDNSTKAVPTINGVMAMARPAILRCYPPGSTAPGKFSVDITVGDDGRVTEANVEGAEEHAGCVLGIMRGLRFAPPSGSDSYSIRYDFVGVRH